MNKEEYHKMYEMEENYWWFIGKRYLVDTFLKKYYKNQNNLKILDVGCGTGITMNMLSKYGKVHGIDISPIALDFCQKRGLRNLKLGKIENLPYNSNEFDFITCLDILYHKEVKDDIKAMQELNRVLKPNGRLILTDSAMKCLYGRHDIANHGIRRYSRKEMKTKLKKTNFNIEKITYYNTLLFPVAYLSRKLGNIFKKEQGRSDVQKINPLFNLFLKKLFKSELYFLRMINYPFGVGLFTISKKIK